MNDPIAGAKTQSKTEDKTKTPLSIKLIGWFHLIILPVILIISALWISFFGGMMMHTSSDLLSEFPYFAPFIIVSLILGLGILKLNKIVWIIVMGYSGLIMLGTLVNLLIVLIGRDFPDESFLVYLTFVVLVIFGFIIWKLVQHRRIFWI